MNSVGILALLVALTSGMLATTATGGAAPTLPGEEDGRKAATKACSDINAYGPVGKAEAVADGLGDWLVWVQDRDGDLWICNASAAGAVYANNLIQGDLLRGGGLELMSGVVAADSAVDPAARAGELCLAVGAIFEDMQVVATVGDGMGDYLVWLKNAQDALWMCNASAESKLYAFEKVGTPLGGGQGPDGGEGGEDLRIAEQPRSVTI